jgi:hypothetical protein
MPCILQQVHCYRFKRKMFIGQFLQILRKLNITKQCVYTDTATTDRTYYFQEKLLITRVPDTGGKLATGVIDTGGK